MSAKTSTANLDPNSRNTLAYTKKGILIACLGGILGGPIGLIVSPALFLFINAVTRNQDVSINRFLIWSALGTLVAPVSLLLSLILIVIGPCLFDGSSDYCKGGFPVPNGEIRQ